MDIAIFTYRQYLLFYCLYIKLSSEKNLLDQKIKLISIDWSHFEWAIWLQSSRKFQF